MTFLKWGVVALMPLLAAVPAFAQPAPAHTAIALEPAAFDKFAGFYRLTPKAVFTISREGTHFYAQLTHQPRVEIFPESATGFFLTAVPAQISFDLDASGQVTGLTLHQASRVLPAPRIDEATARGIETAPIGHPMPRTWPVMAPITPRTLTRVTGNSFDAWPCFSPDGKTVVFSRSTDGGKTWTLMRVPSTGGDAVPFAQSPLPVTATRAVWSAQNNMIAFTGTAGSRSSVWLIQADGGGAHEVTATALSEEVVYPSWYPDGKSVAVMDAKALIIKRFAVAGGAATEMTDHTQVLTGMSSVSPDGKMIAFAGQKNSGQTYDQEENVIWLSNGNGPAHPLETPPLQGRAPVWSPDGKRIAFESDRGNGEGRYALFLIGRDGSGLTQVMDTATDATHPVFSADGRHLVFIEGRPGGANGIAILDLP